MGGTTRVGGGQKHTPRVEGGRFWLAMGAQAAEHAGDGQESAGRTSTSAKTLGAIRVVVEAGWIARVAALQVACIETHRSCRGCQSFRLRIARKTPRKVYQEKFSEDVITSEKQQSSSRVVLPRVVRLLYDLNKFDLKPGLRLPLEILSIVFGTAFGDSIDSIMWPPGLESLVFWRRCEKNETCQNAPVLRRPRGAREIGRGSVVVRDVAAVFL